MQKKTAKTVGANSNWAPKETSPETVPRNVVPKCKRATSWLALKFRYSKGDEEGEIFEIKYECNLENKLIRKIYKIMDKFIYEIKEDMI